MLYLFRKSQRWLLWLLLIVVVITFVFWGSKPSRMFSIAPTTKLSSYDGQKITFEDLQRAKGAARVHLVMYGYPLSEMNDGFLTTQAVSHIVNYRKAEKAGVTVDNSMLQNTLRSFVPPSTSPEAYERYVASTFGVNNTREFEEDVRQILAISLSAGDSQLSFFEPKNEKDLDYVSSNVKADIRYVTFTHIAKLEEAGKLVTSNDVQTLYDKDPSAFAQPEKYRFLCANFNAETNKVQYSENDIKDYFDLYQGDFTKTNEFGETVDMEFDEAKSQVISAFLLERANEEVQERAYAFRDKVATKEELSSEELENDFREAAKAESIQVQDSFTLPVGDVPPRVVNGSQIAKLVEEEPVGTLDVYEASDSLYQVYLVVARSEAYEPTFEEAEKDVRQACVTAKAYELAKGDADAFLAKVKADPKNFEGIATNDNRRVSKVPQPLTPLQVLTRDIPTAEYKTLFRYPAETPRLLNGVNNVYVAVVTEFIDADAAFDTDKMADRIAQQKSALEKDLYLKSTEKEVEKILAELQGNLLKSAEKARQ
ncbi:SurA N-terminal domain-containing protein [bacterium]|nr:SurA N-terminal domain-containing protein [bacterium]